MWGDHFEGHPLWSQLRPALAAYRDSLRRQGIAVDEWELPALGLSGNSHMLMMDSNSDELAARIQAWLMARGL